MTAQSYCFRRLMYNAPLFSGNMSMALAAAVGFSSASFFSSSVGSRFASPSPPYIASIIASATAGGYLRMFCIPTTICGST